MKYDFAFEFIHDISSSLSSIVDDDGDGDDGGATVLGAKRFFCREATYTPTLIYIYYRREEVYIWNTKNECTVHMHGACGNVYNFKS